MRFISIKINRQTHCGKKYIIMYLADVSKKVISVCENKRLLDKYKKASLA